MSSQKRKATPKKKQSQALISRFFSAGSGPPPSKDEPGRPSPVASIQKSTLIAASGEKSRSLPSKRLRAVVASEPRLAQETSVPGDAPVDDDISVDAEEVRVVPKGSALEVDPDYSAEKDTDEASDKRESSSDSEGDEVVTRRSRKRLRRSLKELCSDAEDEVMDAVDSEYTPDGEGVDTGSLTCVENEERSRDSEERAAEVADACPEDKLLDGFQAGSESTAPRNEKRRRRFEAKVGRLDGNGWFMRTTGGLGGGGDDLEGEGTGARNQYALGNVGKKSTSRSPAAKLTPLEQQYVDIKAKNPDTLLLVECGYKFQFFGEDALIASKVCRIYCGFKQNFNFASIPTVSLARHVGRLVQAGHKVGVVRQMDTAALKRASDKSSGPFRRKLCEVYTRGTLFADGQLDDSGAAISGSASSYIFSVYESVSEENPREKSSIAIVALDPATGAVVFDSFVDDAMRSELESRLLAVEPVEVIASVSSLSTYSERSIVHYCQNANARLEKLSDEKFTPLTPSTGSKSLQQDLVHIVETACNTAGPDASRHVMRCVGALVAYLQQFKLDRAVWCATEYRAFTAKRDVRLGGDVIRNFELFHNSNDGARDGSLFNLVDRTKTAFGGRLLKQWLAHPLTDTKAISRRLDAVSALRQLVDGSYQAAGGIRGSLSVDSCACDVLDSLCSCPDLERGLARISYERCTPSSFIGIVEAFGSVAQHVQSLKMALRRSSENDDRPCAFRKSSQLIEMVEAVPDVSPVLDRYVFDRINRTAAKENNYSSLYRSHSSSPSNEPSESICGQNEGISAKRVQSETEEAALSARVAELDSRQEQVASCEDELDALLVDLRRTHKRPAWEWKKVAQEEFLLEVPVKQTSNIPKDWVVVNSTKAFKRFRPRKASQLLEFLEQARELRAEAASLAWRSFLALFATMCADLRAVVRFLCEMDCLASHARTSLLPGYVKPEILDADQYQAGIRAEGARHPIAETLLSTPYVPNDICLGLAPKRSSGKQGTVGERCMVITGPNMGGKSSFIRMAALLSIMAQAGLYVPAKSARVSPFDAMFCRMGAMDIIGSGMSTLMVELSEASKILEHATDRSLIVIDELGRGTSTHDGMAVAAATLEHLVRESSCVVLFVTHFPTIAKLSESHPGTVGSFYLDYMETSEEQEKGDSAVESAPQKRRITFLYKVVRGVAARSYGLNVAQLAGLPDRVIDMAARASSQFDENRSSVGLSKLCIKLCEGLEGSERRKVIQSIEQAGHLC